MIIISINLPTIMMFVGEDVRDLFAINHLIFVGEPTEVLFPSSVTHYNSNTPQARIILLFCCASIANRLEYCVLHFLSLRLDFCLHVGLL